MSIEKTIEKILEIKYIIDAEWEDMDIFSFEDDNVDENFFEWLNENYEEFYEEFMSTKTNKNITDFISVLSESHQDEELLEIVLQFIDEDKALSKELNGYIKRYQNECCDYEDPSEFEEDEYEDYDDYDDYN